MSEAGIVKNRQNNRWNYKRECLEGICRRLCRMWLETDDVVKEQNSKAVWPFDKVTQPCYDKALRGPWQVGPRYSLGEGGTPCRSSDSLWCMVCGLEQWTLTQTMQTQDAICTTFIAGKTEIEWGAVNTGFVLHGNYWMLCELYIWHIVGTF